MHADDDRAQLERDILALAINLLRDETADPRGRELARAVVRWIRLALAPMTPPTVEPD